MMGLFKQREVQRIPMKKDTQHHQNNSLGHSSHRSSSGRSSQKRRSGTEVHKNTAGRRPGNKIKIPTAPCAATLYDIYSDDSPNHRGSSGNSRGWCTRSADRYRR